MKTITLELTALDAQTLWRDACRGQSSVKICRMMEEKLVALQLEADREPGDVADDAGGDADLSQARTAACA